MAELRPGTPAQEAFLEELLGAGLLLESGVPGVYGRGELFTALGDAFDRLLSQLAAPERPLRLSFPPVLPRRQLERVGYLGSFPHFSGSIFGFEGSQQEAGELAARAARGEDWSGFQEQTDLCMRPAACYPVYPAIAARGPLAPGGVVVDPGATWCYRREPSGDPARLQLFRQRELVRLAEPGVVLEWRRRWTERSLELLRELGLEAEATAATDPFFGPDSDSRAENQRRLELKLEIVVPIAGEAPTAVASFNCHGDHFAELYGLRVDGPDPIAHTGCVGFGLERVTLALLRCWGLDQDRWPGPVRTALRMN